MTSNELINKRGEILNEMTEYFKNKDEVTGIFISGSLAEGTADEYSDIDFRVIVEDEHIENYINNRLLAPQSWGELLYNEYSLGWRNMCVSHFKPFVKVDVFYYTQNEVFPSLWHNKGVKIIYDKNGVISDVIKKSKELKTEYNCEELNILINKGIALIHECFRRARRNEIIYANDMLNGLRQKLIEFDDLLNDRITEGSSHFESRGSSDIKALLHGSYYARNQEEILKVLFDLTAKIEESIQNLGEKFKLNRNEENDRYSLEIIKKIK